MALKRHKVSRKKSSSSIHSRSSHSVALTQLQKRAILTFTLFIFMLYGLTQVTVTSPILAQSSVLGEDEHRDEKREEKREEKHEERRDDKKEERHEDKKPEIKKTEYHPLPPKPRVEFEQKVRNTTEKKPFEPVQNQKRIENERPIPKFEDKDGVEHRDSNELESEKEVIKRELIKRHEVEIRTQDGQKIKTKVEDDGSKKIEIEGKDFKLKYELHNGKFEARAEDENGDAVDIPKDASRELEDSIETELEEEGIEVDSTSDKPSIMKNGVRARSEFPLAINPLTKVLTVTTPQGEKEVSVLPDEAMKHLKETGVLDEFEAPNAGTASEDSELITYKEKMAYKIKGKKRHRVLGFIPVNVDVTSYVSAETGEPLDKEQSLYSSIISSLSF